MGDVRGWLPSIRRALRQFGTARLAGLGVAVLALALLVPAVGVTKPPRANVTGRSAHSGGPGRHRGGTHRGLSMTRAAGRAAPSGREVLGRRTARSRTWKTRDGRFHTRTYATPVNYKDAHGNWRAIDDTLKPAAAPGYAFENRADRYRVEFPEDMGARPIDVSKDGDTVGLQLLGAHGHGRASGASATFANALPGVTASYMADSERVKENLRLSSPDAPAAYDYDVTLSHGLSLRENARGGVDVVGRGGAIRFSLEAPYAYDRGGARIESGPQLSLKVLGAHRIRLAVDRGWLRATDRRFPVVIDPGIDVSDNQDCYIASGTGANTSFCGGSTLKVGWDGTQSYRALLRFDVASTVPANSMVTGSHLMLYLNSATTTNQTGVAAYQATRAWTGAATWNKFDGVNAWTTPGGDLQAPPTYTNPSAWGWPSTGNWYAWGVTDLVQRWLDGATPNYGVLLKEPTENVNNVMSYTARAAGGSLVPYLQTDWEPKFMGDQGWYPMVGRTKLTDKQSLAVNADGGNLVLHSSDLQIAGVGLPFTVDRTYNNLSPDMDAWGYGWNINGGYDMWLSTYSDVATLYDSSGTPFRFTKNTDGSYTAPPGIDATLKTNTDGTFTVTYNESGTKLNFSADGDKLNSVSDNNGHTLTYSYNADLTVASVTDTEGRVTTFAYDNGSWRPRISQITDSSGRSVTYTYYASGGPLKTFTDGAGNTTTYSYDGDGSLTQVVDGKGNITQIGYDTSYRVTSIKRITDNTTLAGDTTTFAYNSGNTVVTDPAGHSATYYFDSTGRATQTIDALGHQDTQSWTSDNQPADHTTPVNQGSGAHDHNGYDANNNRSSYSAVGVGTTAGATSTWSFNGAGAHPYSPDSATNPQGQTLNFAYDSPTASSPNLQSVSQTIGGSATTLASFTFDAVQKGQINSSTDANGNVTTYHYDANHVLDKITPPIPQGPTTLGHDGLSRITSVQDGLLQTTGYTLDGDDRATHVANPDGSYVNFTFDAAGNVTQVYDSIGPKTETFTYDRKNRLTGDSGATGTTTYTYDSTDNIRTMTDAGGTVTYAYDAVNNTCWTYVGTTSNGCATPPTGATRFSYDANDNRTHAIYPGSVDLSQTFDTADRLTDIKGVKTTGPTTLTDFAYGYNDTGGVDRDRRASVLDASNNKTTYTYDTDRGWLLEALTKTAGGTGTVVSDYKFRYDRNGNLIHRTDAAGTSWTTLGYDGDNQLCWKVAGNLADDSQGRQPCTPTPTGATTYTHDADGQETAQSGRGSIAWNSRHQATSIFGIAMTYFGNDNSLPLTDGADTFKYSAFGLSTKTTGSSTSYYTRDPNGALLNERTPSGTYNYLYDGLGSTVAMTDSTGSVVKTYKYDPYGAVTASTGTVENPWQFAHGYLDAATGLEKFGRRYYDSTTAGWTEAEPLDARGIRSGNRYMYAGDNPVNGVDASGCGYCTQNGAWRYCYESYYTCHNISHTRKRCCEIDRTCKCHSGYVSREGDGNYTYQNCVDSYGCSYYRRRGSCFTRHR